MTIEAVVFDLGRVMFHWDPEGVYDRVVGPKRREAFFAEVPIHDLNAEIDRGAPFRDSLDEAALRHPDYAEELRFWHDGWLEMASPAIEGSAVLLRSLRARHIPVYALSNLGLGPLALAEQAYPVLREFDRRFFSAEYGVLKPDPRIYEVLEDATGHPPETLLFTDDKRENIQAAAARGWQTHLFEGPVGWAARLVSEGLLDADPL